VGKFLLRKSAARDFDIARVMTKAITGRNDYPIKEIGIRPGEKFMKFWFLKKK